MNKQPFETHGVYTITNSFGVEVQVSPCGEMARYRAEDNKVKSGKRISKWYEVERVWDSETDEFFPEFGARYFRIPLTQVMRI